MQVQGTTTREIADQIRGQAMNGVLRAKVLGVDAILQTNNWKLVKDPVTLKEEYYMYADDVAPQDPKKIGGEDIADEMAQALIDNAVTWTRWNAPIIHRG